MDSIATGNRALVGELAEVLMLPKNTVAATITIKADNMILLTTTSVVSEDQLAGFVETIKRYKISVIEEV